MSKTSFGTNFSAFAVGTIVCRNTNFVPSYFFPVYLVRDRLFVLHRVQFNRHLRLISFVSLIYKLANVVVVFFVFFNKSRNTRL